MTQPFLITAGRRVLGKIVKLQNTEIYEEALLEAMDSQSVLQVR